ncbi:hypothetical protein QNN03_00925 [Streptomyces sp. GXMU-J15]|uniref:Uncharacterized protein n=1 Tax=Streptomyces fuscus TaxID=3048495 RepID=A0ABT7IS54_9ACTN|nr:MULTISPECIES: hypothetical protein [Streptomyces]MDL2074996.1 hypothetical protein [Streptomyces fuscus]SBT89724.1 hypothetical protein GA0115233_101196 [Streptomyces sp. DI166]
MSNDRKAFLIEAKEQGCPALSAVRQVRDDGLWEAGKEFNVAVDLKAVYGLTPHQLHDVVAWLRGIASDEELENSLRG